MSEPTTDPGLAPPPGERWTFDADVANAFDDMLARSIPQYDVMRDLVFTLGVTFATRGSDVVDLGCSRGGAFDPFLRRLGPLNHYVGVEISDPMLAAVRERYKDWIANRHVDIRKMDLRREYPKVDASLTLLVLTLQFVPIEYRPTLLERVHDSTRKGGAVVLVEKVLSSHGAIDQLLTSRYLDAKRAAGYSDDAIERKRLSLEGVLVPVSASMNEAFLHDAGFRVVECVWRWCNFAMWIGVKS
jgi:tRNA (cmo5U34)-methyltransferase